MSFNDYTFLDSFSTHTLHCMYNKLVDLFNLSLSPTSTVRWTRYHSDLQEVINDILCDRYYSSLI